MASGKAFQVKGTAGAKALRWGLCLITLENFKSLLPAIFSLKIDKHKCCPPKRC